MNLVSHHEGGVKSKSEVADHVILCCLVLIFLQELCGAGESDLGDVLLHLAGCHTHAVVDKFQRLLLRIYNHMDLGLIAVRKLILSHHIQLFQLGDGITSVGDHLTDKDIVV